MSKARCKGWSPGKGCWGNFCRNELKTSEQVKAKLCGRHLAGQRRREATAKAQAEKWAQEKELLAKARAVIARLAELGVRAIPHYNVDTSRYTGRVVIEDGEALASLLETRRTRCHCPDCGELARLECESCAWIDLTVGAE